MLKKKNKHYYFKLKKILLNIFKFKKYYKYRIYLRFFIKKKLNFLLKKNYLIIYNLNLIKTNLKYNLLKKKKYIF